MIAEALEDTLQVVEARERLCTLAEERRILHKRLGFLYMELSRLHHKGDDYPKVQQQINEVLTKIMKRYGVVLNRCFLVFGIQL